MPSGVEEGGEVGEGVLRISGVCVKRGVNWKKAMYRGERCRHQESSFTI